MQVRDLRKDDLEPVARLFMRRFRREVTSPASSLVSYMGDLFLEHPWYDPDIASRVAVDDDGTLVGFVGVMPMHLAMGDRTLRGAICTTLMLADPGKTPMAAAQLVRKVLAGPQDISMGDTANFAALSMWERLQGTLVPLQSLSWYRILRPAGWGAAMASRRFPGLSRVLRPLGRGGDAAIGWLTPRFALPSDVPARTEDLPASVDEFVREAAPLERGARLTPLWDDQGLAWFLNEAARRQSAGPLHRRIVRLNGRTVGAYLFFGREGGVADVLHLFASPQMAPVTLQSLLHHVAASGFSLARGGAQPSLMTTLFQNDCFFRFRGATVIHARDPAVAAAVLSGQAMLGGFFGEWWTRFVGDEFE